MPGLVRQLTLQEARDFIKERSFHSLAPDLVGLETEWLVVRPDDATAPAPFERLRVAVQCAGRLPGGSAVTYEPGGQLELSGPPASSVGAACEAMAVDVAFARRAVVGEGLALVGDGLDPLRPPHRVIDSPRYRAMETFFAADGADGERMMSCTASLQVNVGMGPPATSAARWRRANVLGPALLAAFANSPMQEGRPTGWKSTRLATWWVIDPSRTAPVGPGPGADAWADYALAARVMLIREEDRRFQPQAEPLSFERWIREGHDLGHPTLDDLEYHLTTLFPPVRPRGWLEVRYLDALPDPWWRVAATVLTTLLLDETAGGIAERAAAGTEGRWLEAARSGLHQPDLASASLACFRAALEAGARAGADPASLKLTAEYCDRYTARRRCPADDRLASLAWI
jgi:glutamate--cysteine ligase